MTAPQPVQPAGTPAPFAPSVVQVPTDHYAPAAYDELHRWASYWHQIQAVVRTGARRVLEVGVGSGVLSAYLRQRLGLDVTTCDFDASLRPDLVGDVRQLDAVVPEQSFDAVVAFQVLEHLPFADFVPALRQLARASRRHVILSLPHYGWSVQGRLRLWKWNWAFSRRVSRFPRWQFNGEHHWEIGTRGHALRRVRAAVASVLAIERDYFCPDYSYHYFFETRKPAADSSRAVPFVLPDAGP
jgi:2-polyprenyl-3-methyl-5-hydroxy-6-metoxy-1,4-benzoquinol methylase